MPENQKLLEVGDVLILRYSADYTRGTGQIKRVERVTAKRAFVGAAMLDRTPRRDGRVVEHGNDRDWEVASPERIEEVKQANALHNTRMRLIKQLPSVERALKTAGEEQLVKLREAINEFFSL